MSLSNIGFSSEWSYLVDCRWVLQALNLLYLLVDLAWLFALALWYLSTVSVRTEV